MTGAAGLIGSEAVRYFLNKGHLVWGIDNNMRAKFFGPMGDVTKSIDSLRQISGYSHFWSDITIENQVSDIFKKKL